MKIGRTGGGDGVLGNGQLLARGGVVSFFSFCGGRKRTRKQKYVLYEITPFFLE
jgi:hypothetical protein